MRGGTVWPIPAERSNIESAIADSLNKNGKPTLPYGDGQAAYAAVQILNRFYDHIL